MPREELAKMIRRTNTIVIFLSLLWIPYFIFLGYWMSVDETLLSQLVFMLFIVPAIFQPLFWYLVLGGFLWIILGTYQGKLARLIGIVEH